MRIDASGVCRALAIICLFVAGGLCYFKLIVEPDVPAHGQTAVVHGMQGMDSSNRGRGEF